MGVLPPPQITLNLAVFFSNLIKLDQFKTVLVLHDQTTRNPINNRIATSNNDIAWVLVNDFDNSEFWNNTIIKDQNLLILTALHSKNINSILNRLYFNYAPYPPVLNIRSNNLIVLSDISKVGNEILSSLLRKQINAVLVDWTSDKVVIYAWNTYSTEQLVVLNETEFLQCSNAANDLAREKYTGLFFDRLQNIQGKSMKALITYEPLNVISKDSDTSIDGTAIQIYELISNATQSALEFVMPKTPEYILPLEWEKLYKYLEQPHKTFSLAHQRRITSLEYAQLVAWLTETKEIVITANLGAFHHHTESVIYPHKYESLVIVVKNNMIKTSTTALQRILMSPLIYFWLLLIILFVALRCGLQWINSTGTTVSATKRRRCVYMCEDTVQLSCGVVIHTELLTSHRYRHALLAHGATIIPLFAGMFITGILYGDFITQSEAPSIDSIKQLEESNLTVCVPFENSFGIVIGIKNTIITKPYLEMLGMIWSGNTNYAYMFLEHYASILDVDHLQPNGRPMFRVMKDRFAGEYMYYKSSQWFIQSRINAIATRTQEHGLAKYFENACKRTYKKASTVRRSVDNKSFVASAGSLDEILACVIYLVGISCGLIVFILENFSKRNSA